MPTDKGYKELEVLRNKLSEIVSALDMILGEQDESAAEDYSEPDTEDSGYDPEMGEEEGEGESLDDSEEEEGDDSPEDSKERRKALVILALKKKNKK